MFAASPARIYHHHIYDDSKDGILYGDGDASSSLMYTDFADFSFAKFRLLADIAINSLKVPTLLYNIGGCIFKKHNIRSLIILISNYHDWKKCQV